MVSVSKSATREGLAELADLAELAELADRVSASPRRCVIHFKCEVHSWMTCYLAVFEHPFFAVSKEDGTYTIKNVPDGDYTIHFWHEKLATTPWLRRRRSFASSRE